MSYTWSNALEISPSVGKPAEISDVALMVDSSRVSSVNIGDTVYAVVEVTVHREGQYKVCIQVDERGKACTQISGESGKTYRATWTWVEKGPEGEHTIKVWLLGVLGLMPVDYKEMTFYVSSGGGGAEEGGEEEGGEEERAGVSVSLIPYLVAGIAFAASMAVYVVKKLRK